MLHNIKTSIYVMMLVSNFSQENKHVACENINKIKIQIIAISDLWADNDTIYKDRICVILIRNNIKKKYNSQNSQIKNVKWRCDRIYVWFNDNMVDGWKLLLDRVGLMFWKTIQYFQHWVVTVCLIKYQQLFLVRVKSSKQAFATLYMLTWQLKSSGDFFSCKKWYSIQKKILRWNIKSRSNKVKLHI